MTCICYYVIQCIRFPMDTAVWYISVHPTHYTLHSTITWQMIVYATTWEDVPDFLYVCTLCDVMRYTLHPIPYNPPLHGALVICATAWCVYWNSHIYSCVCYDSVCYHAVHPTPHTLHSTIIWRIRYVFHCMIWCTGIPIYTSEC